MMQDNPSYAQVAETQAVFEQQVVQNLERMQQPGTRITSKKSGNERLVIGKYRDSFLLTVLTNANGEQSFQPIPWGKVPKVAKIIAENRKYDLVDSDADSVQKKEMADENLQVGNWVIAKNGTLRKIISIEEDLVVTTSNHQKSNQLSYASELLSTKETSWVYALLPPESSGIVESFMGNTDPEVIGETVQNELKRTLRFFTTPHGIEAVAGCDIGFQDEAGKKTGNQDRVVVVPQKERFAVIDGVKGSQAGEEAAEALAKNLVNPDLTIPQAVAAAKQDIKYQVENGKISEKAAAAYIAAEIIRENNKIFIEEHHMGDAAMIILDRDGNVVHQAEQDSIVSKLLELKAITEKEAARHSGRNLVSKSVSAKEHALNTPTKYEVKPGYRVILASDGITDNLMPNEIAEIIRGKTTGKAMGLLSEITTERMKNQDPLSNEKPTDDQNYSDGYYCKPKADNRGILIFDVV